MEHQTLLLHKFNGILEDPVQANTEELTLLLEKHPYSHVFQLLEAKRSAYIPIEDSTSVFNKASLYAKSSAQLYSYIYSPSINDPKFQQEEAVAKLDQLLSNRIEETIAPEALVTDIEDDELHYMTNEEEMTALITIDSNKAESANTREDVSKYDDDLMPYTFVWWLHKTRLEHADTYQPYAPKTKPSLKYLTETVNDIVLDQQIRENIFHLQSPEDKLSVKDGSKTVAFKVSHQTDDIIERFIKEEPQIKPPQANKITLENKARQSAEDQSTFVSETLAQIYAEQGLFHKAIDTYMKLSLKYPEKSVYFADRIKDLENKIN
ncbi:hypothetical protein [Olivibacter domesticus]|uniref:Tetratricopeptide repeat-containing protein n=1 Tax=Olivibacter domesticus TaxID=407022 RepID=A0A1H7TI30_OLID1|nr:hypothetical protein [Olivibacter domesticus]SEL84471.1 hypothetical protein SAMN05661044_03541 [Olivibacter domesticus]